MEKIVVRGGNRLEGEVEIEGAKNAVLPILAAAILPSEGRTILTNVPMLSDVYTMNNVIRFLNVKVGFDEDEKLVEIDATGKLSYDAPFKYVSKMRASIVVLGPLLARLGKARVAMPGGCAIGSRPIDLHLKGLELLGAKIEQHNGYIDAHTDGRLVGANIYLDFPSVGATQNIMMAATLAKGTTIIENVAREPEIVDLANVLNKMGAKVYGAGTEKIKIIGVESLHGTEHAIIQDRIEAGTFMVAAGITNSKITINGVNEEHLMPTIEKLKECGVYCSIDGQKMIVDGTQEKKPVDIKTMPYPGFPTDMQAQIMALLSITRGVSVITETVFENRFMHVGELGRMGANIKIDGRIAIVEGVSTLTGCEVKATDLRAGAAMILAGLVANGETEIGEVYHIDRGYTNIEEKFKKLGAEIYRIHK